MAVAVDFNSATLRVTAYPRVATPKILDINNLDPAERGLKRVIRKKPVAVPETDQDELAYFTSTEIEATGSVRLLGGRAERATGWEMGFIQAEWCEINWAYYRGLSEPDGSLLLQLGRPPARLMQGCLDASDEIVKGIWYSAEDVAVAGSRPVPLTLTAEFYDKPGNVYRVVEQNSRTGQANYLSEMQNCVHFCTVLAVRDPGGKYQPLASFRWNVRQQANFSSTSLFNSGRHMTTIATVQDGTGCYVSPVVRGLVKDHRFDGYFSMRGPVTQTCNRLVETAYRNVQTPGRGRYESPTWRDFNEYR